MRLAPRSTASRMRADQHLALFRIGERSSMLSPPEITISRLLKSCATPPVSWPTASSFCACRSCFLRLHPRRDLVGFRHDGDDRAGSHRAPGAWRSRTSGRRREDSASCSDAVTISPCAAHTIHRFPHEVGRCLSVALTHGVSQSFLPTDICLSRLDRRERDGVAVQQRAVRLAAAPETGASFRKWCAAALRSLAARPCVPRPRLPAVRASRDGR